MNKPLHDKVEYPSTDDPSKVYIETDETARAPEQDETPEPPKPAKPTPKAK